MDKRNVTVATITWARDAREEARLLQSLQQLSSIGLPVVAADGGSPECLLTSLRGLDRFDVLPSGEARGLVSQVRSSLRVAAASGSAFILYTESDKYEFFRDHLDDFIARAPDDTDVGIVIAARSPASFATFPRQQQETEEIFNRLCGDALGDRTDYTYGPFLMRPRLIEIVEQASPEMGWGWRPYVFASAVRLGMRLVSVSGDYVCPPEQRLDAESAHRLQQLDQNIAGLLRVPDSP